MSKPTLAQIETFVWIARLGSFHQTAARLNLSQPTISLRIRQLEMLLGAAVFERQGHHPRLSKHGEELLPIAERLIDLANQIESRFTPLSASHGVVRLGLPESVAATCLSAVIKRIAELAPLLRVDVTVEQSSVINRMITDLSLDVAILADPEVGPTIKLTAIGRNPLAWVSSPSFAPKGKVTPPQLAEFRILTSSDFTHNSAVVADWFAQADIRPSRITACNSLHMITRLICDGVGIGVLPLAMVQSELEAGLLVRLSCSPALRSHVLQAAYHFEGTNAGRRAVETVLDATKEVIESRFAQLASLAGAASTSS